jgi:hypothetical protein
MSETQVALRFPRASPRSITSRVGGLGLWYSELPTSTSVGRFLARGPSPRAGRLSPAWGSPRFSPACLPPCVRRPGLPGRRPPDLIDASRVQGASRTRSVRYHRAPPSGLSKESPLHRHHRRCPLPGSLRLPLAFPSAGRCQRPARSALVVSHHLDGFLHRWLVGLLHPTADPGVHRVSPVRRAPLVARVDELPTDALPSRAFPTRAAVPASLPSVAFLSLRAAFLA